MCVHFMSLLVHWVSNHSLGQKQSGDGGQGQAQPGGPGQAGCGVAQVAVAACFGHGINGGVGVAGGEVRVLGLVALRHC